MALFHYTVELLHLSNCSILYAALYVSEYTAAKGMWLPLTAWMLSKATESARISPLRRHQKAQNTMFLKRKQTCYSPISPGVQISMKWVPIHMCLFELRSEVEPTKLDTSCSSCCFLIPFLFHFLIPQFLWSAMTHNDHVSLLWTTGPKGKTASSSSLTVCVCISAGSQPNLQVMPWSPWIIECLSSFNTFCNLIVRMSIMLPFETSVEIWLCNIHGLSSNYMLFLMYCFNDKIPTKYSLYLLLQLWHWNVFSFLLTPITACFGTTNKVQQGTTKVKKKEATIYRTAEKIWLYLPGRSYISPQSGNSTKGLSHLEHNLF